MRIVTGSQMAEIDRITIQDLGYPGAVLMENAARSACKAFVDYLGEEKPSIVCLCGSGNNGGDGFCIARILNGWGYSVTTVHVGKKESLKGDALINYNLVEKYKLGIINVVEEEDVAKILPYLENCDWIVDAIFGTGLSQPVRGVFQSVLAAGKKSGKKSLAVDIPSGVNSDNGEVLGDVIPAELTVTFGLPKWGHFLFPGAGYRGGLVVSDIGFPSFLSENNPEIRGRLITEDLIKNCISPRSIDSHKSTNGKLSVIGGSDNLVGAALISAKAALKCGAGYVRAFIPKSILPASKGAAIEIVTRGLSCVDDGNISEDAENVLSLLRGETAVVLGPGLETHNRTRCFVEDFLLKNDLPCVIDADGLNILAKSDISRNSGEVPWVLTPHMAEAARLLKIDVRDVLNKPLEVAETLVDKYNAVVVLKGAYTLVVSESKKIYVNNTGNPSLSVIGSGDVLSGMIGAFLAKGIPAFEAAAAGVFLHGLSADIYVENFPLEGLSPVDLLQFIPLAIESARSGKLNKKIAKQR